MTRKPVRKVRGFAAKAITMAVLGATTLVLIGLSARRTELRFEDRSRCRAAARWAAESGVERARARVARGLPPAAKGSLSGAQYAVEGRVLGGLATINATGSCTSQGREVRAKISVTLKRAGTGWTVAEFEDLPVPRD